MRQELIIDMKDVSYISISCSACKRDDIIALKLDELGPPPDCLGECKAFYDLLSALRRLQGKVSLRISKPL